MLKDSEPVVRAEARRVLAELAPLEAVPQLAAAIGAAESSVAERQSAVRVLAGLKTGPADEILARWLDDWARGEAVPPEIQLELLEAAATRDAATLRQLAKAIESARPADNPVAAFSDCLVGGDAARGRNVFFGNAAASCRRCHKINGVGSEVGPDLSEIGKTKARDYLLEAIVNPNAKIAEGFETAVFQMDDGLVHSGVIKGEDDKTFRLMTPQGEVITVEKEHVDDRAKGQSGMPADLPKQISRRDLRDLVEFLTTLKEKQAAEGHH
jgi:quinoprotein glucose dehydrogenase